MNSAPAHSGHLFQSKDVFLLQSPARSRLLYCDEDFSGKRQHHLQRTGLESQMNVERHHKNPKQFKHIQKISKTF